VKASQIERLGRLHELRSSGALSDEEFEAQKRALLKEKASTWWPLIAGVGLVTLGGAVALGLWSSAETSPQLTPIRRSIPVTPNPEPSPTPPVTARSAAERLADAFQAATGHRAQFTRTVGGEAVTTTPIRLVELPFGPALLTRREIKDGCHACTGAIGVYYLRENGNVTTISSSYPNAVEGWGWGAAPTEWQLTTRFTATPAIYAEGGYTGQGITMSSATITELTAKGPVTSDVIGTGFTNAGAITDDDPRQVCDVDGKIANIVKDRSFDVAVSGSISGRDRYIKREGRFVAVKKADWEMPCPS
jgi:hypothetical protein